MTDALVEVIVLNNWTLDRKHEQDWLVDHYRNRTIELISIGDNSSYLYWEKNEKKLGTSRLNSVFASSVRALRHPLVRAMCDRWGIA